VPEDAVDAPAGTVHAAPPFVARHVDPRFGTRPLGERDVRALAHGQELGDQPRLRE
jgi:hypothetical protein